MKVRSEVVSESSPRIVIIAFAGSDNLGDECLLQVEIAALRARYPSAHIAAPVVMPWRVQGLVDYPIPQLHLLALAREIARADIVILGGGGVLQDDTSILNLLFFLIPIRYAARSKVPCCSYGLGVGPIHRRWLRRLTGRSTSGMSVICVRDEDSREQLLECGVSEARIRVTADPALAISPTAIRRHAAVSKRPRVVVALRGYRERSSRIVPQALYHRLGMSRAGRLEDMALKTLPTLRWLAEELDAEILFLAFQNERDERVHRSIAAAADLKKRTSHIPLPVRPSEALEMIAESDLVLGMRLHACVLAAAVATPFVALGYTSKVWSFAASIGLPKLAVDLRNCSAEDVFEATQRVWQERATISKDLFSRRDEFLKAEAENLKAVEESLTRSLGAPKRHSVRSL